MKLTAVLCLQLYQSAQSKLHPAAVYEVAWRALWRLEVLAKIPARTYAGDAGGLEGAVASDHPGVSENTLLCAG